MGNFCGTDIYKEIKEKYPEQFSKFVVGQEIKKSLNDQVDSTKAKVSSTADSIQKENLGIIGSKQTEVQNHFENAKADVDKYYLGGVKGLEQTRNAKIEDLLGYTAIQQKYQNLKQDVTSNFSQQSDIVQKQLATIQKDETEKIAKDQPKLDLYNQLSDKLKGQVYQSGVKEYKDQIQAQGKAFLGPLQQKLSPVNFTGQFKNLLPADELKSLTNVSKQNISKNVQGLIGNPGEGRAHFG